MPLLFPNFGNAISCHFQWHFLKSGVAFFKVCKLQCTAVSSPDVAEVAAEEADDHYWWQALKQRARVCGHVSAAGYDIEVIDSDGLRRALTG